MLDISIGLLIFNIILFIGLIVVLNKIMYKPLMQFIQNRDERIAKDLESVNLNDSDTQKFLQEAEKNISEAKKEASDVKSSMIEKAKEEISKEFANKKEILEKELEEFMSSLNSTKETLKKELSANLSTYKKAVETKVKKV